MTDVQWKSVLKLRWFSGKPSFHTRLKYFLTHGYHMNGTSRQTKSRMAKHLTGVFRIEGEYVTMTTNQAPPWETDPKTGKPLLAEVDAQGNALPLRERTWIVPKSKEDAIAKVRAAYESADGGYGGAEKLFARLRGKYLGITRQLVTETLRRYVSRQMEAPEQGRVVNPVQSQRPMERIQADTMEISQSKPLIKVNLGFKYILHVGFEELP